MRIARCTDKPFRKVKRTISESLADDLDGPLWAAALRSVAASHGERAACLATTPKADGAAWAAAFGQAYNRHMDRAGMTGFRVAADVALPVTTLQDYRKARSRPAFYRFVLLAALFGVRPSELKADVVRGVAADRLMTPAEVRRKAARVRKVKADPLFPTFFAVADACGLTIDRATELVVEEFKRLKAKGG